jgi:uncharacterized DUF497 family protein
MRFVWDDQNTAHLAQHGVTRGLAEQIFTAGDRLMFAVDDDPARFIIEGTVETKTYRMVFALVGCDDVYPITMFRIASNRRRKA